MADDHAETSDLLVQAVPSEPSPTPSPIPIPSPAPLPLATAVGRRGIHDSWWRFGLVAVGVIGALATLVWASTLITPGPTLQRAALFVHLSSLVVGFGAVLVADYFCLLWLVRRSSLTDALVGVSRLHPLIWLGLAGLTVSGALLQPHLTAPLTRVKLGLVVLVALNGLQAIRLSHRMLAAPSPMRVRLVAWGGVTAMVSQGCWWGAVLIGFLTATGGAR
jgi:hypothetical protein